MVNVYKHHVIICSIILGKHVVVLCCVLWFVFGGLWFVVCGLWFVVVCGCFVVALFILQHLILCKCLCDKTLCTNQTK